MSNFNDLKARYSHVLDRLSEVDTSTVANTLEDVEANLIVLESFVVAELGSVVAVDEAATVEEAPVTAPDEVAPVDEGDSLNFVPSE